MRGLMLEINKTCVGTPKHFIQIRDNSMKYRKYGLWDPNNYLLHARKPGIFVKPQDIGNRPGKIPQKKYLNTVYKIHL